MTKKHFKAIAMAFNKVFRVTPEGPPKYFLFDAIHEVANVCASTNDLFDRAKFIQACIGTK